MSAQAERRSKIRRPLTRERVLRAAIELADAEGVDALTMRRLGQALGVEAMSLYNHVASKDDILAAIVDVLVAEIPLGTGRPDWRAALRQQALAARALFARHPWAPRLISARSTMSPAMVAYMDSVVGTLQSGELPSALVHDAMHVLGSRILGFTMELFDTTDLGPEVAGILSQTTSARYPHLAAALDSIRGHDDDVEFVFGLDLILDGLERARIEATDQARVERSG
jgi:AcrR family transcriptional regulator